MCCPTKPWCCRVGANGWNCAPQTLEEAINTLMIAYHHVPSATGMPVYVGQLDDLLLPFCDRVSDEALYKQIKLFWRYIDRVLPDVFLHANIGPPDNRVARTIPRVDAELGQIAPKLTFRYDPAISPDATGRMRRRRSAGRVSSGTCRGSTCGPI